MWLFRRLTATTVLRICLPNKKEGNMMDVDRSLVDSFYDAVNSLLELRNQPNLNNSESVKPGRENGSSLLWHFLSTFLNLETRIFQDIVICSSMEKWIWIKNYGFSVHSNLYSVFYKLAWSCHQRSTGMLTRLSTYYEKASILLLNISI